MATGVYGNVHGPDNVTEYATFLNALVADCVREYGLARVQSWQFRVGTECNYDGHWSDTEQKYLETYAAARAAAKKNAPLARSARIRLT